MKKNRVILTTASLASLSIVTLLTVFLSLAWFTHYAKVESKSEGEALVSYFAYGNGTKEDPYGITQPRHLYNLAWLQDLGYFNKDSDGDSVKETCYFELAADIDMSAFSALPPIGTEKYPFIGNFSSASGKKYTISNLKVSNDFSDFTYHPGVLSGFNDTVSQPHIVGFFGVIGEIGTANPTDYDSSALSISDFNLAGATITSKVSATLVGIAAGYVNGTLKNVGITRSTSTASAKNSTITLNGTATGYTTSDSSKTFSNVSDYTLVGYAEDSYKDTVYHSVTNISNPYVEDLTYVSGANGDSEGWGGSIDMKSMYNHIQPLYSGSTIYSYVTEKNVTVTVDSTGQLTVNKTDQATSPSSSWTYASSYTFYNSYATEISDGKQTSSFSFSKRYNSGTVYSQYLYLSGRRNVSAGGNVTWHTSLPSINSISPQTISDGSGNYLACVSGSVANSTSSFSDDTLWYINGTQIFTLNPEDNFSILYLTDNSGTLSLSSTSSTSWTVSSDNIIQSALGRYLIYSSSGWSLTDQATVSLTGYYIYDSDYDLYLQATASSVSTTSSSSDATLFFADNSGYYYTLINDVKYYLTVTYYSRSSGNITITQAIVAPSNALSRSGNYLKGKTNNRTYYLVLTDSPYMYSSYFYASTLSFPEGTTRVPVNLNLTLTASNSYDTSRVESRSYTTNDTYFPLQYDSTNTTAVSSKNTGYVISGANENSGQYADIRVSYYPISSNSGNNLGNSDFTSTSSTLSGTNVYTINSEGSHSLTTTEISNYSKFADSLSSLQKVLTQNNSASRIYGLHFMNASISEDHLITIPYASVEGTEYTNYQLPEDSIDFRLKEKGYVNFFAGTYFPNNNSFFSLHRIFRNADDPTKIDDIKEISGVYQYTGSDTNRKAYCYVYQYSDGTYSTPYWYRTVNGERVKCAIGTQTPLTETEIDATSTACPSGYTLAFSTSWIKTNTLTSDAVYYFEIPMNDGEFALGSVSKGTGAYLMYLDIGGNASTIDRTKISEKITNTTTTYSVPKGIALLAQAVDTVKNLDSACVLIESGYTGTTVSLQRESDTSTNSDTVILTGYNADNCYPTYSKIGMKVTDTDKKVLDLKPLQSTTKNYYRLTTIDYSENSAEYTKTVIVYDPDKKTYSVKSYDQSGKEITDPTIYSDKGLSVGSEEYSSLFADMFNNTATYFTSTALGFTYQDSQPSSFTFSYDFTFTARDTTTGKTFYQISVYTFTVTNADGASSKVTLFIQGTPSSLVKVKELDASDVTEEDWKYSFQLVHDGTTITLPTDEEIILNP